MLASYHRIGPTLALLAAVAALTACGGDDGSRVVIETAPTATAPPQRVVPLNLTHGIDVSAYSGEVDWSKVTDAGFTFAVVKASEGVDFPDPEHDRHWQSLTATNLTRGAYHFYVTEDDPEAQAKLFIDTARLKPGDLAPVVDVELIGHHTGPGLPDRLHRFLEILEDHYGVKPIIYTTPNFWNAHLPPDFGDYPLWIAEFGVDSPHLPHGWDTYHLWQYVDDQDFDGIEKDADLSRGNLDPALWEALVIPAPSRG